MADHASIAPSQTQFSASDLDTHLDLRGLAELAFGSLTRAEEPLQGQHLALLQAESLELDLDDPAQRQFGDYELWEFLGEGGMGAVYRARHKPLDRDVAVKLLSAGPWASKDFIARFEREAQNAARMQHPNIVTVFETGQHDGLHFFSMRLIEGFSLSVLLKRGEHFSPKAAAALMRTLAEAVAYAHSLGVLHLDLKPGNVLIDAQGTAYVADFGLARRLDSAAVVANDEVSGTPAYMAPEQAQVRSSRLTVATDVWGLGAILYELLTGSPPFRADTAQGTLKLVLGGQVRPPRRVQPSVPMDLQAVAMRCLARDPRERYASARELADDLARYVDGRPVLARPLNAMQRLQRWARREPRLAATAALALLILVVGLVVSTTQWQRAQASAVVARDNLWATRAQNAQQALAEGDGFRSLRPLVTNLDEMQRAGRAAQVAIERQRIGSILANAPPLLDMVKLPSGEFATAVAIAPDGQHFAVATTTATDGRPQHHVRQFVMNGLHETWSVDTDHRSNLRAAGDAYQPLSALHYTDDGRFLLASLMAQPVMPSPRTSDMLALDVRDGRVIAPAQLPRRHADIVYGDMLKYALVRYRSDPSLRWPDSAQFYEVAGWRPIGPLHTNATTLAADLWLPVPDASAWLGTRDSTRLAMYDVPSLKPRWQLQLPATSLVRAWGFSHDSRWLALGSVDGAVRLVDARDGHAVALGSAPVERVVRVAFSADNRTLAAVDENGQVGAWDVATGLPRAAAFRFARGAEVEATLHFAGDTLIGGGWMDDNKAELDYTTLAPHALFNIDAVPGSTRVHGNTPAGSAFDVSSAAKRMVVGSLNGWLQVWGLPPSPLHRAHAAPLMPAVQAFDGKHLVAVDGKTVRVLDAASGQALSPPLLHPEAVRLAELSPDGKALVTLAGRTLRIIDPRTWTLRAAPIVLPQTPVRALFAQAAPRLVLVTQSYEKGAQHEHLQLIDLAHGTLRAGANLTTLSDLAIDAEGRYAIVGTWNSLTHANAGPLRIALDTGAVSCAPKLGDSWNFALAADGRSAWFGVYSPKGMTLQRWNLDACKPMPLAHTPTVAGSAQLMARGGGLAVHRGGSKALILIDAEGNQVVASGEPIAHAMFTFAVSADGGRAAFATRNAVEVLDARTGRRLSARLTAPIAGDDGIARLSFSPDGTRLLARSVNGRWLTWTLPRSTLDVAALQRLVDVLDPDPVQGRLTDAAVAALQKDLRARTSKPGPLASASTAPVVFAAVANAGVDPRYLPLDLAPAINIPLIGVGWAEPYERSDRPTLAPGLQRFLGVDYRIEGGVQLIGGGTATALGAELHRSATIRVPDVLARRVHVLAFMHTPMDKAMTARVFAYVVLTGRDGRETRLAIHTVRDVVTDVIHARAAASARIGFSSISSSAVRTGASTQPFSSVYTVALDVPAGTGPIKALRFETRDGQLEAPLLFAATLERAESVKGARVTKP